MIYFTEILKFSCVLSYLQGDPFEVDWKNSFYGKNYERLLEIKDKYDPSQLLYGSINVGGDRWMEDTEGRLCRVQE